MQQIEIDAMSQLENLRHERFAHYRSKGMSLEAAYERAGYVPNRSHASRLAARRDVRERIFNMRLNHTDVLTANLPDAIHTLMQIANESWRARTTEGFKEARVAVLEAVRLQNLLDDTRLEDRRKIYEDVYQAPEGTLEVTSARAPEVTLPARRPVALPEL